MNAIQPLVIVAALILIITASAKRIQHGIRENTLPQEWLFAEPASMTPEQLFQLGGIDIQTDVNAVAGNSTELGEVGCFFLSFCEEVDRRPGER